MKWNWLILICMSVVLVGVTVGQDRKVVTRGVAWLDSPETVRSIEKNRRDERIKGSYGFTDVYKDRLNDETEMVVKYEFFKYNDEALGLVEIRIDFIPAKHITFLAVGERLQERYGETVDMTVDMKDVLGLSAVLVKEAGVSYNLARYGRRDYTYTQMWYSGDKHILHDYRSSNEVVDFHFVRYQFTKKDELQAAADSIKLHLDLERARQGLSDGREF